MICYRRGCNKERAEGSSFCSEACRDLEFPRKLDSFEAKRLAMLSWGPCDPETKKTVGDVIEQMVLTK